MVVQVCIGSACHLKGSYEVIQQLKGKIAEGSLEDQVLLKSSFCLGQCAQAVSVKIDDEPVYSVSPDTVDEFFNVSIKGRL
ncbi:NAD(P)H-dependent oxidoreductase subunit E [Gottschalkiaceae bacterium SANA]|nr:NAD(P)H-dependent oxidoreductase subunit E [Gottschalkiaceae bacterium SANA]